MWSIKHKLDGSEDHLVNIRGIEDYTMPIPVKEFHLQSENECEEGSERSKSASDTESSSRESN